MTEMAAAVAALNSKVSGSDREGGGGNDNDSGSSSDNDDGSGSSIEWKSWQQ
jgi:hypothetical protein